MPRTGPQGRRRRGPAAGRAQQQDVLALTPTDEVFDRRPGFVLAEHWDAHLADLDHRRLTATARVRVSAGLRERLPDHPSHPLTAAVRAAGPRPPGPVDVDLPIESIGRAAADLVVFGAEAEALDPPELRTALAGLAAEVSALYGAPSGAS